MLSRWMENAACVGMPIEWFAPHARDHRDFDGMTESQVKKIQNESLTKGLAACRTCPVVDRCYDDGQIPIPSLDGDETGIEPALFTIRGGVLPATYSVTGPGRPRKGQGPEIASSKWANRVCSSGHVGQWTMRHTGYGYCTACARDRDNARRRAKTPEEKAAAKIAQHVTDYGHEPDINSSVTRPYCRTCSTNRNLRKRELDRASCEPRAQLSHEDRYGHPEDRRIKPSGKGYCRTCDSTRRKRVRDQAKDDSMSPHEKKFGHVKDGEGRSECRICARKRRNDSAAGVIQ